MAKHKYQKALARLLREIIKFVNTLNDQFVRWFTRSFFVTNRRRRSQAGFVLPTIAMMLMVVALVVTAVLFRTFTRSTQVIEQGQKEQVINAATPAIDRAKAKLEYLFTVDGRIPAGIPDEKTLESILLNDGSNDVAALPDDPYTFPDEDRVDIGGENGTKEDNVWKFTAKDGTEIIYGIASRAERGDGNSLVSIDPNNPKFTNDDKTKVDNWLVRNGPVVTTSSTSNPKCPVGGGDSPAGWFANNDVLVFKSFQAFAFAKGKSSTNPAIATLQYQQDRTFERGNKWGAWFRYDLEIYPGPRFRWNGAIHTEGNLYAQSNTGFRSYLLSAPESCFFNPSLNSSLSARGHLISAVLRDNAYVADPRVTIDIQKDTKTVETEKPLTTTTDSVTNVNGQGPVETSTDPLSLLTRGISIPRVASSSSTWEKDADWDSGELKERMTVSRPTCAPYVDDTYRADNRYGPKPSYTKETLDPVTQLCNAQATGTQGTDIPTQPPAASAGIDLNQLVKNDPPSADLSTDVGLDGYWERRARFEGLRVIVGQRLELGNPAGWNVDLNDDDGDNNVLNDTSHATAGQPAPTDRDLYPAAPDSTTDITDGSPAFASTNNRRNEFLGYRTLRDNLAAVQSTAVYHKSFGDNGGTTNINEGGYFPVASLATTVHPGTQKTLSDSTTFSRPRVNFKTRTGAASIFGADFGNDNNEILANFFTGEGTNGWEFQPIRDTNNNGLDDTDRTQFINDINNTNSVLRRALRNLAYFAGDPEGAFPPTQETAGSTVHPHPVLTMWGDFSNLRRAIRLLDTNAKVYPKPGDNSTQSNYLSLADQSYIQTAASTLGMLAYNISYLQEFDYANTSNQTLLNNLDTRLQKLSELPTATNRRNDGEIEIEARDAASAVSATNPLQIKIYSPGSTSTSQPTVRVPIGTNREAPPPDAFIAALEAQAVTTGSDQAAAQADLEVAKLIHWKEQVERDRKFGFRNTPRAANVYQYTVSNQASDFSYAGITYNNTADTTAGKINTLNLGCDFSQATGNNYFGFGAPTDTAEEQKFIRLATALCPVQPKFPSLYYLFPKYNHDHQGTPRAAASAVPPGAGVTANDYLQPGHPTLNSLPAADRPTAEPYVTDAYIMGTGVNGGSTFQYSVLQDADNDGVEEWNPATNTDNGIAALAIEPRNMTTNAAQRCTGNNWCLPAVAGSGGTPAPANLITERVTNPGSRTALPTSNSVGIAFADKAMFDGREIMSVRLLDIDLNLLRQNTAAPASTQESWLPTSGLVYAFREDALREEGIARPQLMAETAYANYSTDPPTGVWYAAQGDPTGATNIMNVWGPADPPRVNQISPKPVDYFPDPGRRPYGFRLRNGSDLRRTSFGDRDPENLYGLSLISDNPVYIQGNFNLHTTSGTNVVEEFTQALSGDYNNFYTRTDINTNFARGTDRWRPSEMIADAVNILSNSWNVCSDGTVQSGIRSNNSNTFNGTNACTTVSSYENGLAIGDPADLATSGQGYICENPFDLGSKLSTEAVTSRRGCDRSLKVFRNGEVRYFNTANPAVIAPYANYRLFNVDREWNKATETRVNAIIVSGVVPSRVNNSNGGLHNFPRLNEDWGGVNLHIAGSLLQLNFSNYATAPYDQDTMETSNRPATAERIGYYQPANRRWGYDVGLQYASAPPVAKRMVTPSDERSEFYRELPANDPYICKLRDELNYPCP